MMTLRRNLGPVKKMILGIPSCRLEVLAPLPLGWDQRTKSPTKEHHPMPCWPCRAPAAGLRLVARLGRSSCVSLLLLLFAVALAVASSGVHRRRPGAIGRVWMRRFGRGAGTGRALRWRIYCEEGFMILKQNDWHVLAWTASSMDRSCAGPHAAGGRRSALIASGRPYSAA